MSLTRRPSLNLTENGSRVREMAMTVFGLMRNDEEKLIRQAKRLIKKQKGLAFKVFTENVDGWTPVHACSMRGSKKLLKTFFEAEIDVNMTMGQPEGLPSNCTMLHLAAHRGDLKIIKFLISKGANVEALDGNGNTPAHYAAARKNKRAFRLLEEHGANVSGIEFPATNKDNQYECITPQPSTAKFCFFS
ncbi:hypothetical protein ACJMK2_003077 [Sinanodonta woodiana]|uniref:Uncharacterized protein n=1 Tax=Sinanodonta woodiana TaxID=1069815 RepID=A0ABD3XX34_SINWO